MMYNVRRYVDYKWIYVSPKVWSCGIEMFKLRKLPSKFQQLFVIFHEMYLSYHGQILLKFGIWIDNGTLKTYEKKIFVRRVAAQLIAESYRTFISFISKNHNRWLYLTSLILKNNELYNDKRSVTVSR